MKKTAKQTPVKLTESEKFCIANYTALSELLREQEQPLYEARTAKVKVLEDCIFDAVSEIIGFKPVRVRTSYDHLEICTTESFGTDFSLHLKDKGDFETNIGTCGSFNPITEPDYFKKYSAHFKMLDAIVNCKTEILRKYMNRIARYNEDLRDDCRDIRITFEGRTFKKNWDKFVELLDGEK
jgi:hypothetical protein